MVGSIVRYIVLFILVLCSFNSWSHGTHGDNHELYHSYSGPINTSTPTPWTHLNFNGPETNFQFAIVTDRTGGARQGVFSSAIDKLNLLQPEFVMSVGDLIDGYVEETNQINREWNEIDGMVNRLNMPFFYTAGNHDYSNDTMADIWEQRYGPSYYHFNYRDSLFVVLNSNDGGRTHTMSQKQLAWLKNTLNENPAFWTFVFVHAPLWDSDEQGRWPEVDALLGERKYTVFAGHNHRYVKQRRNNRNYYTLATTGGGSDLRGASFGEFDHVAWVTMTRKGPVVANLVLDGILPDDIRDEHKREYEVDLIEQGAIQVKPILFRKNFKTGSSEIVYRNNRDIPVHFEADIQPLTNISINGPLHYSFDVPPNSRKSIPINIVGLEKKQESEYLADVAWKIRYKLKGKPITYSHKNKIGLSKERLLRGKRSYKIDGVLDEWNNETFFEATPLVPRSGKGWQGKQDGKIKLQFAQSKSHLLIALSVQDDSVYRSNKTSFWSQDTVHLYVDARPKSQRIRKRFGREPYKNEIALSFRPPTNAFPTGLEFKTDLNAGIESGVTLTSNGYTAEIAIPNQTLDESAGGSWDGVRVKCSAVDADASESYATEFVWPGDKRGVIPGEGSFYRRP